jgi:tryptophan synthase alpha chain
MIAFYPDGERCLEVAKGLIDGGSTYLEVQFPFSEPTADGPAIQMACNGALSQGFTVDQGFAVLREIRGYSDIPIFVMSYANLIFIRGVEAFLDECVQAGVNGIIAPDMPPDYDEGLYAHGRARRLEIVPVVSINISDPRLRFIATQSTGYLYAALRRGITGEKTEVGAENFRFLQRTGTLGLKVMAGFGISERSQVELLLPHVHAVIVGSAFVRVVMEHEKAPYGALKKKILELLGSG